MRRNVSVVNKILFYPNMAVFRVLCRAFIFILKLQFPLGSLLTRDCVKMLIHNTSRLKRNVMAVSRTSYPLFPNLLTDSAFLQQFFLRYDRTSILRPLIRFSFVWFDAIVSIIVSFTWFCNLSCFPFDLDKVCP